MSHPDFIRAAGESSDMLFASAAVDWIAAADGADKLPTFSILAYTGVPMNVPGFAYPVVLDLAGVNVVKQEIPALFNHDQQRIIGQSSGIKVTGKNISISGIVTGSADDADVKMVTANAKNGFKWQASVGAQITRREFIDAGKSMKVNGRNVAGPAIIGRESVLREISFVSLGADENTAASIAASSRIITPTKGNSMNFDQWLTAAGFDPATISEQQKTALQAAFDAEVKAKAKADADAAAGDPDPAADAVKAMRAGVAAEQTRIAEVTVKAKGNPEILAKAIAEGWDADKAELEVLRALRSTIPNTRTITRNASDARTVEASLCLTAGMREEDIAKGIPAAEREKTMNAATAGNMRGYSLHALFDSVIAAGGNWYNGNRKSSEFIRAAFESDRMLRASGGGFSSISLSGVLSAVANKSLLTAYTGVEVVWPQVAALRNNTDFKTHSEYRMDSVGAFKKIGPDGDLKHIGLTDSTFTRRLDTFGAIVALTRQMIVNDDLGAFLAIPSMLGRLAALRIEEAVFVLLLSNPSSFFASGNGNYATGAGSALSITSLTAAVKLFRDFVIDGKPVLTTPKKLLVGTGLEVTAKNLMSEKLIIASAVPTSANTMVPAVNPHAGLYQVVVSPYLNNTGVLNQDGAAITGQTATLWYLLADPMQRAVICAAFLNGNSNPTIESAETSFDTLGMQWRAYADFGVGMLETQAGVLNDGA